jgi:hypothetical protein
MSETRISLETGEIIEPGDYAPCGRKWGAELWPGGPVLGGENWREFVKQRASRESTWTPRN